MPDSHHELPQAGPGHPLVRQFLESKRHRTPEIALEGLWALRAAIAASIPLEALFLCPELLRGNEAGDLLAGLPTRQMVGLRVSERLFRRMTERDGPDGLAALARPRPVWLDQVPDRSPARVLVADGLELPGNLGTAIRCADGVGASAVLVAGSPVRITHPLVVKASMGTVLSLPVLDVTPAAAIAWLRANRYTVIAADPEAARSYRDVDYGERTAVVVGNERRGLSPDWRRAADVTVSIPMLGAADSLNVGHASALLLYEALWRHQRRQRHRA